MLWWALSTEISVCQASKGTRKMQVTKEKPVHHRRIGYPNTGYAFHFVRCLDHKALRDYVRLIPGVKYESWFGGGIHRVPDGFTVCTADRVIPGVVPEAVGDFLCEVYVVVAADDDVRKEKHRWWHEIGHAVEFAGRYRRQPLFAAHDSGGFRIVTEPELWHADVEFPGMCNELLCEALDCMFEGDINPAVSGFESLFSWLNKGVAK